MALVDAHPPADTIPSHHPLKQTPAEALDASAPPVSVEALQESDSGERKRVASRPVLMSPGLDQSHSPNEPNGQNTELVPDAEMAEPVVNGAHESNHIDSNGHAMQVDVSTTTNGINGHAELKSPSSPSSRRSPPDHDDDSQPPPAKRPRTLSEEDQFNNDSSATAVASPLPTQGPPSSAAPSPETPAVQVSSISGVQHRFCLSTVRTLKKLKDAAPFLKPVDPIALNIPHYPNLIKRPMDLGTIEQKLLASKSNGPDINPNGRYFHVNQFVKDVKLVFENCYTFNGPDHFISLMAKRLEAVFDKQIKQMPPSEEPKPIPPPKPVVQPPPPPPPQPPAPAVVTPAPKKATLARRPSTSVPTIRRSETDQQGRPKREIHPPAPKDLPYADAPRRIKRSKGRKDDGTRDQLKFCAKILLDLQKRQYWEIASPFYEPVDWVKLEIPSYPKIIKKPMDLSTMKRKLDAGEYSSADRFWDDFKLMIRNCFTFNPEGTPVNQAGLQLQKVFDDKWHHLPPLREVSDGDDDENEEDSDDEQAKAVAAMETQIEVLRGNLAAMKKKPKKEKRKDKSAGVPTGSKSHGSKPYQPGKGSKKSKKGGDDDVLSFEQKKELSETIASLEGPKLERVIQIIHEGVPEIRDSTEEIELDIDSLPSQVLMKLYNFVLRPLKTSTPKRSRGVGGGTGGLKRKSMDEDVEAERIRQLEQRIALFEPGGTAGVPASGRSGVDSGHSSDDSSDDSSGSESE